MSTEPDDPSTCEARAANLSERARILTEAGPANAEPILRSFANPSWHELHADERCSVDLIAETAATVLFGKRTRDRLPKPIADALEQAATYLVRRIHPEWVKAAHEQAVDTLMLSDQFRTLMRDRSPAQARIEAHRLVTDVRAAFHSTLEGTIPIKPVIYLELAAAEVKAGAR